MAYRRSKSEPPVLCRRAGRLGRITLNRPKAINALTMPMFQQVTAALDAWENDHEVSAVLLDGAGERGFCAGGDITVVHQSALSDHAIATELWRTEYLLDARLARYPKPVVAFMDGIVMGGGLGLSAHAAFRVVTERSALAMPEVAIGLAPDAGGCFVFAQAPGEIGTHLALTGTRVAAADAIGCGFADWFVPSAALPRLAEALRDGDPATAIARFAEAPGPELLSGARQWIDSCYAADDVAEIRLRLADEPVADAAKALAALDAGSPTALKVTLRALRNAREMRRLGECLVQDLRVSCRFLRHPDLVEGIRATVIDKDRRPRWRPATLAEVGDAEVDEYFRPLGSADLLLG